MATIAITATASGHIQFGALAACAAGFFTCGVV